MWLCSDKLLRMFEVPAYLWHMHYNVSYLRAFAFAFACDFACAFQFISLSMLWVGGKLYSVLTCTHHSFLCSITIVQAFNLWLHTHIERQAYMLCCAVPGQESILHRLWLYNIIKFNWQPLTVWLAVRRRGTSCLSLSPPLSLSRSLFDLLCLSFYLTLVAFVYSWTAIVASAVVLWSTTAYT